jgi:hypothetical protein
MLVPSMFSWIIGWRRLGGWARPAPTLRFQGARFLTAQGRALHRICPDEQWPDACPRSVLVALPLSAAERKRLAMHLDRVLLRVWFRVLRHCCAQHGERGREECCGSKHWVCLIAKNERPYRSTRSRRSRLGASILRSIPNTLGLRRLDQRIRIVRQQKALRHEIALRLS